MSSVAALQTCREEVVIEWLRYQSAVRLAATIHALAEEKLGTDASGVLPAAIFEGHKAAAAGVTRERCEIHSVVDVRRQARVRRRGKTTDESECLTLQNIVCDNTGARFGLCRSSRATAEVRLPLQELELAEAEPTFHDALLPALETILPAKGSSNVMSLALSRICDRARSDGSGGGGGGGCGRSKTSTLSWSQKKKLAWAFTDAVTYCFYEERKALDARVSEARRLFQQHQGADVCQVELLQRASSRFDIVMEVSHSVQPAFGAGGEWATLSRDVSRKHPGGGVESREVATGTKVYLTLDAALLEKLHRRFRHRAEGDSSRDACAADRAEKLKEPAFLLSVARLLLRYSALGGGAQSEEAGWHAAVPPEIMDTLSELSGAATAHVECFASPFNAHWPLFFSAFADTDAPFGSLGSFFQCDGADSLLSRVQSMESSSPSSRQEVARTGVQFEMNPPFDYEVVASSFQRALSLVQQSSPLRLSFLVVIPDSTRERAQQVRAPAEQNPACRASVSVPAEQAKYVDGGCEGHARRTAATHALGEKRPRDSDAAEDGESDSSRVAAQHLVKLSCPTRLMVLQNDAAERFLPGKDLMNKITTRWSDLSQRNS